MDHDRILRLEIGVIVLFAAGVVLRLARTVLVPFALALLLAYAVSPALDQLLRRKIPRPIALAVIFILTFVFLYLVGSVLYTSGKSLAEEIPAYNEMVSSLANNVDDIFHSQRLHTDLTNFLTGFNVEKAGRILATALGPFVSFISELFLVLVFMFFILAGRGSLAEKVGRALQPGKAATVRDAMNRIDRGIQRYLAVKALSNLILGAATAAVFALFGVPFAALFGILTFLVNYIPTLGTIFGLAASTLFAALMLGEFGRPLLILLILTVVSILVTRFLERKLMGGVLEISPLLMLFTLFFGGWLWGVAGMILAVPFLAMVKIILSNVPALAPLEKMMGK